jgi:cell division septation protein DedD
MAESEDVNALKRRGRRRLVGAIALVLAAVIVLPMVFDSDPRGTASRRRSRRRRRRRPPRSCRQ